MVLPLEQTLWYHLRDIHNTHKPNAEKKRHCLDHVGTTKRKRPRLHGKLDDGDSEVPSSGNSALKRRSKQPLGYKFVNISAMERSLSDVIETAVVCI